MATNVIKTATNSDIEALKKRQRTMSIILKIVTYIFLIFMAFIVIFPFYWMIISSLKSYDEYHLIGDFAGQTVPTFFPTEIKWENYYVAFFGGEFSNIKDVNEAFAAGNSPFQYMMLVKSMIATLGVGVVSTVLSIFITIFAAFAFGRLEFKGKELIFTILLMTMMVPGELFTITNYETVSNLKWTSLSAGETGQWKIYLSYIVPFLVSVFYIYLLRNNFKQIPDELYYAAKVDGASDFKYLFKVMVPLSMPSIISIIILKMMGAWNSYIWPNLVSVGVKDGFYTMVSVILRQKYNGTGNAESLPDVHLRMAACVIVSIPLFIVFALFRKYIIRGVSKSGIKG